MMINIVVCDDEQESLNIIQEALVKAATNLNIAIETHLYMDGNKVVDLICNNREKFDILFLDIEMPTISGFEVAKKIRESENDIILIFISAHEQYVFESMDYNPLKYIRKNKIDAEIEFVLERAYRNIQRQKPKTIIAKTEDGEVRLKYSNIVYFEMNSRKISVFTKDNQKRKIAGRKTIKELCEKLNDERFVQIHSGCIVNVKYIDECKGHNIILENGMKLIVSRSRIKEVKETMLRYWSKRL